MTIFVLDASAMRASFGRSRFAPDAFSSKIRLQLAGCGLIAGTHHQQWQRSILINYYAEHP